MRRASTLSMCERRAAVDDSSFRACSCARTIRSSASSSVSAVPRPTANDSAFAALSSASSALRRTMSCRLRSSSCSLSFRRTCSGSWSGSFSCSSWNLAQWSQRSVRPSSLAPLKLSTASTVLRWSSYPTNAKPRGLPVFLSRGRWTSTTSPSCEKTTATSPSVSPTSSPPTYTYALSLYCPCHDDSTFHRPALPAASEASWSFRSFELIRSTSLTRFMAQAQARAWELRCGGVRSALCARANAQSEQRQKAHEVP